MQLDNLIASQKKTKSLNLINFNSIERGRGDFMDSRLQLSDNSSHDISSPGKMRKLNNSLHQIGDLQHLSGNVGRSYSMAGIGGFGNGSHGLINKKVVIQEQEEFREDEGDVVSEVTLKKKQK